MLNMIKEEYDTVRIAANRKIKQANLALKLGGEIMRYQNNKVQRLEKLAKRKTVPTQTVGVQFSVRDVFDIPEVTDVQAYFKSVNSFVVGGQVKSVKWALIVISDVLSQKLWADYQDHKHSRELCTLKVFVLQYFFKYYGCRVMAIALLKDFLATLKSKFLEEQRVEMFLDLCGHSELKHAQNIDIRNYLNKNEVSYMVTIDPAILNEFTICVRVLHQYSLYGQKFETFVILVPFPQLPRKQQFPHTSNRGTGNKHENTKKVQISR